METTTPLPPYDEIREEVRRALAEDVGSGDLTAGLIPREAAAAAVVIAREAAVVCGRAWFDETYHQVDERIRVEWHVADGDRVAPEQPLCHLSGPARGLLTGERTALNFLQTLSGTATVTRLHVDAVEGSRVRILDTRKTLPGLRLAQKYAVRCGGGANHRMGLYDAVLIKENHIAAAGSVRGALAAARAMVSRDVPVEIEVEELAQLEEALEAGAQRILLDNMGLGMLRQAVELTRGRARLEASGGVSLENLADVAKTGVDDISLGSLTKHLHAVDLSMRFIPTS